MKIHSPLPVSPRFILSPTERRVGRILRNPEGPEGHQSPPANPPTAPVLPPAPPVKPNDPPAGPDNSAELARLSAELAEARAAAARFEGLDPEAARTALAEREAAAAATREAERATAEAQGNWERVRELMTQERDAKEAALQAQIDLLKAENGETRAAVAAEKIGNAFAGSKFITDKMALPQAKARALYQDHAELEDGVVVLYDKPKGAPKRTKLVDGRGQVLDFDAAFEKIIAADPDKDRLLIADVKPGTGSRHDGKPSHVTTAKTTKQKLAEGLAKLRGV